MKITAAILDRTGLPGPWAESRPLRLAEVDLAPPRPGELLVRIDAAGICHSDLSVINGDRPRTTPMVLGHEASATVIEANACDGFAPGDRVVLAFLPSCGRCADCAGGQGYLCAPAAASNLEGRLMAGGRRLSEGGHEVQHFLGLGAFATHAVIDQRSAVRIAQRAADGLPPEIAALFGCAVLTGVGAVINTGALRAGQSLAVWGLGGVGLAAVLGGVAAGAEPILAIDPVASKRALALALGATAAFHPDEAADGVAAATDGGAEVGVETVGNASALAAAYAATRRGGRTVTAGLPPPGQMLSISAASLVTGAKTLVGSYMGSATPARDIPRLIALCRAGRLPVERLLTSVHPLSEINSLFDRLAGGAAIRQVVRP